MRDTSTHSKNVYSSLPKQITMLSNRRRTYQRLDNQIKDFGKYKKQQYAV